MAQPIFQQTSILENNYHDSEFCYTLVTTITDFPNIVSYCQTSIPTYSPNYTHLDNKIAFNNGSIYEINFYKNIITVFPVALMSHSTFEKELKHLKTYLETFVKQQDINKTNDKTEKLLHLVQSKLFIYSPYALGASSGFNLNMYKTSKTLLGAQLIEPMFESYPIPLNYNNFSGIMTPLSNFSFSNTNKIGF
jgi:hypothetical protein